MSKKKIIILSVIVILIGIASILSTYALDITMTKGTSTNYDMSLTFDISGNVNKELSVEAGKTKTFDIVVNNPYTDTITYGITYKMLNPTTKPDDLIIAVTNISENPSEGMIDANSKKVISLIIVNDSTSNIQVSLSVINGYKNGGDLIIPTGYTIISEVYEVDSTSHRPIDNSGANYPDLVDGLIPVVYNETTNKWVKADTESSTSTYGWYDYSNKKWANAVLVTETNRSTYQSATAGTEITDSNILAFYVWIPRYKYKVWNINKVIGTDSYNARTTGIDIVFESDTETTGTISCTYNFNVDTSNGGIDLSTTTAETCTGTNGDYYTHPAFNFGDVEVKGFWIGKFELTGTNSKVTILPSAKSLREQTINSFNTIVQNMQTTNNIYGLSTDKTTTDSHMIKNMEWGAVAYLTNSNYGRCAEGSCTEVMNNNCSNYITGVGASILTSGATVMSCTSNKYTTITGEKASTTENLYGVYDMSGGAYEYVMGNSSVSSGEFKFNTSDSKINTTWYELNNNKKYLDEYAYASIQTSANQQAYNRGRLGDATGEVILSSDGYGAWYADGAHFASSSSSWFYRGGYNDDASIAGIFNFDRGFGLSLETFTTRAVLVGLS